MKKLFGTILIMIIFAAQVSANTISAEALKKDLLEVITKDYSQKTSAELDIKITMLPFQSITLPDGEITYEITNTSDNGNITSRDIKRINILVDNKLQRSISVPLMIKAYEEVLVAAEDISRDQPINSARIKLKKINIADKSNFVITKTMMNKEMMTKKEFKSGEFIDKRFIKVRPDVTRNTEVRIILNSDTGFQIAIDGIAKTDGTMGEYVTVENKMYNKTYTGKVIGENRVQVNI